MKKTLLVLLIGLLSIPCLCQEQASFDFTAYRTVWVDGVIDLTQEEPLEFREEEVENARVFHLDKTQDHQSYFYFEIGEEVNLVDHLPKTVFYADFVQALKAHIRQKNTCLKENKIKKAVSFDNLIYPSVLIKIEENGSVKGYRSQMKYIEYVI